MMSTMTQNSNQMLMPDGIGWGGYINVPAAAPPTPPPSPFSSEVQFIFDNILRLQCMGPLEAEKILRDTAALQGPYED